MKTFLVPALLLGLVGVAAALAAGSAPAPAVAGKAHHGSLASPAVCPMSSAQCDEVMGEKGCPGSAAKHCEEAGMKADCKMQCEEEPAPSECCKKKMECSEKAPVEKP